VTRLFMVYGIGQAAYRSFAVNAINDPHSGVGVIRKKMKKIKTVHYCLEIVMIFVLSSRIIYPTFLRKLMSGFWFNKQHGIVINDSL